MINEYITDGIPEYAITLFPDTFKGICVDVGAYDPFWISNSWIFEKKGWDVYCIEPNPHCIPRLKKHRKNVLEYACNFENIDDVPLYIYNTPYAGPNLLNDKEWLGEAGATGLIKHPSTCNPEIIKVKTRTLDWIMDNEIKRDHIDYLSIDVELNEMSVLKGLSLDRWGIKVISIENLYEEPEQIAYLTSHEYRRVNRITVNDFYIHNDYYKQRFG